MLYPLASCVIILFSRVARASPSTHSSVEAIAVKTDIQEIAADPNITLGQNSSAVHANTAEALFPATLLLCNGPTCDPITDFCLGVDLRTTTRMRCFAASLPIVSAMIMQSSGEGLPFPVFVGPDGCHTDLVQIPSVNQCFSPGAGLNAFAIDGLA